MSRSAATPASRSWRPPPGYPAAPRTGDEILGVESAAEIDGVTVFHAGTARNEAGVLVTAGGRALDVTATAPTLRDRWRPCLRRDLPHLAARHHLPSRTSLGWCRREGATVIPRYSRPEMAALFSDEAKFGAWLEVEILACEAWADLGVVPRGWTWW